MAVVAKQKLFKFYRVTNIFQSFQSFNFNYLKMNSNLLIFFKRQNH